jgi:hypothetical protein
MSHEPAPVTCTLARLMLRHQLGVRHDLLAAAFLLDALAKDDPLSQVAGVDPADFHFLMCHWKEVLGWSGQFHPLELMAGALERFLPEVMVRRWADLANLVPKPTLTPCQSEA